MEKITDKTQLYTYHCEPIPHFYKQKILYTYLQEMDTPTLLVTSAETWESWLADHYVSPQGVWLKIAKKSTGLPTVNYDEVLDIALCYGWIDGQRKAFDDQFYLQKFTPRRPRSLWSKRNIVKVESLIRAGKMQPSGQAEIDKAKQDGRWQDAYDSAKNMTLPQDFIDAISQNPAAKKTFESLNKTNLFSIGFRLATAKKPETRQRRMDTIIQQLSKGTFK